MHLRNLTFAIASFCTLTATQSGAIAATLRQTVRPAQAQPVTMLAHFSLRESASLDKLIAVQGDPSSPQYHHWLTPAQFRAGFGPTAATVNGAVAALNRHGFHVIQVDSQLVHFTGSVAAIERAFSTRLHFARSGIGRGRPVTAGASYRMPADIAATGLKMMSLVEREAPQAQSHVEPMNRNGAVGPYWFDDLKQAYKYPAYQKANGAGVTIATVNFVDYSDADASAYFGHELLGSAGLAPAPVTQHLFVGGPPNEFDPANSAAVEPDLDIQQAGGSAPGATILGIADSGYPYFMSAYSYIVDSNAVDIASTSYGECELDETPAYTGSSAAEDIVMAFHDLYRQGNAEGITFIASSGDEAGRPCFPQQYFGPATGAVYPTFAGVDDFADDPNVTAVGGTNLATTTSGISSKIVSQNAFANLNIGNQDPRGTGNYVYPHYFGSGGGVSTIFAEPDYQQFYGLKVTGRAVPDVSMHMGGCQHSVPSVCTGNESGDELIFGGQTLRVLGTSAAAPEFAGLLAAKEQTLHTRFGNENYDLYVLGKLQQKLGFDLFFTQGIPGSNGLITVKAKKLGYNEINGLGTPVGNEFTLLPLSLAGTPQTASNP